ncbi:hypothetical protein Tco_0948776 [Tanacetum coccineum]
MIFLYDNYLIKDDVIRVCLTFCPSRAKHLVILPLVCHCTTAAESCWKPAARFRKSQKEPPTILTLDRIDLCSSYQFYILANVLTLQDKLTFKSLPLCPSVITASSLNFRFSTFSFVSSVFKIDSLLSTDDTIATRFQGHTLSYNTSSLDGRKYSSFALEDQSLDHLETKLYD